LFNKDKKHQLCQGINAAFWDIFTTIKIAKKFQPMSQNEL
jgi:hypothetical protein